jgi:hypothetical protein
VRFARIAQHRARCLTIEDGNADDAQHPMWSPRTRGPITTASSAETRNDLPGKPTTLRESRSPPARDDAEIFSCTAKKNQCTFDNRKMEMSSDPRCVMRGPDPRIHRLR